MRCDYNVKRCLGGLTTITYIACFVWILHANNVLAQSQEPTVKNDANRRDLHDDHLPSSECLDYDFGLLTDADGNLCNFYTSNTGLCGTKDTPQFHAGSMCCACGGGSSATPPPIPAPTPIGGQCQDYDFGLMTDADGNLCNFYTSNTGLCGTRDTLQFHASSMCCACGGGSSAQCHDFDFNLETDADGNRCNYYASNTGLCGTRDTPQFHANSMCCACGGGSSSQCLDYDYGGSITDTDGNYCD